MRTVALVGSTGSIGTQALQVVAAVPERFSVTALAAGGGRPELLARQAAETGAALVAVADEAQVDGVRDAVAEACRRAGRTTPRVVAGEAGVCEVAASEADVVLNGMTGSAGLAPTLAALDAGRVLALANKESLVAGGPLVMDRLAPQERETRLVPVDSEHSALAQCLRGGRREEVARLVLTASGGPFRGRARADLAAVTPAQAAAHPTWDMGPVITVNSATLVNKGLEVVEAHLLFGVPYDDLAVVVHPQSMIHSMVEFVDGSTLAQASPPDMRLPIALALAWPERVPRCGGRLRLDERRDLDVRAPGHADVPRGGPGGRGRAARRGGAGVPQRRQRGARGGVRGGPAAVPGDRRHPRRGRGRGPGRRAADAGGGAGRGG